MPKITIVCSHCGSDDVMRDAYAVWSVEDQEWVTHSTYDNAYCYNCSGDTSLIEKELTNV